MNTHDIIAEGLAKELGLKSTKINLLYWTYRWTTPNNTYLFTKIQNGQFIISDWKGYRGKKYDLADPNLLDQLRNELIKIHNETPNHLKNK